MIRAKQLINLGSTCRKNTFSGRADGLILRRLIIYLLYAGSFFSYKFLGLYKMKSAQSLADWFIKSKAQKRKIMLKNLILSILLAACAFVAQAEAQTTIAPEKQAAIKELIALINSENKATDLLTAITAQMETSRRETVKALLDDRKDLTAQERKSLEDSFLNDEKYSYKRFQERLTQKLDYDAMMNEVSAAIFDKYYSLEEIKDLTAFYRTPTGQKSLKIMPTVFAESMAAVQQKILPKLLEVIKELNEEDRREIEEKINAKKPRPKKPDSE